MAKNKKTSRVFESATSSSGSSRERSGGAEAILKLLDGARFDFLKPSEGDAEFFGHLNLGVEARSEI